MIAFSLSYCSKDQDKKAAQENLTGTMQDLLNEYKQVKNLFFDLRDAIVEKNVPAFKKRLLNALQQNMNVVAQAINFQNEDSIKNDDDTKMRTLLSYAAEYAPDCVDILLQAGANTTLADSREYNSLAEAIRCEEFESAKKIIDVTQDHMQTIKTKQNALEYLNDTSYYDKKHPLTLSVRKKIIDLSGYLINDMAKKHSKVDIKDSIAKALQHAKNQEINAALKAHHAKYLNDEATNIDLNSPNQFTLAMYHAQYRFNLLDQAKHAHKNDKKDDSKDSKQIEQKKPAQQGNIQKSTPNKTQSTLLSIQSNVHLNTKPEERQMANSITIHEASTPIILIEETEQEKEQREKEEQESQKLALIKKIENDQEKEKRRIAFEAAKKQKNKEARLKQNNKKGRSPTSTTQSDKSKPYVTNKDLGLPKRFKGASARSSNLATTNAWKERKKQDEIKQQEIAQRLKLVDKEQERVRPLVAFVESPLKALINAEDITRNSFSFEKKRNIIVSNKSASSYDPKDEDFDLGAIDQAIREETAQLSVTENAQVADFQMIAALSSDPSTTVQKVTDNAKAN